MIRSQSSRVGVFAIVLMLGILLVLTAAPFVPKAHAQDIAVGAQASANRYYEVTPNSSTDEIYKILSSQNGSVGTLVVMFEPGTYKITRQLRVYSNTTILFNGATLRNKSDAAMMRFGDNAGASAKTRKYNGVHDVTLDNGVFDGDYGDDALLHFSHANNISIKNMKFKNVKAAHHVEFAACKNVSVTKCTFSGYKNLGSSRNDEALQMDVLYKGHFSDGAYDCTPCANVTITGCTFTNVQRGVGTHSNLTGSFHSNITISNNTFRNIPGYAIIATNYSNSKIRGNVISNCAAGILYRTVGLTFYRGASAAALANANTVISGNSVEVTNKRYSTTSYGIQLYGENIKKRTSKGVVGDYRARGVTVYGNTVNLKDSGYGVWAQGCVGVSVVNNTINSLVPANGDGKGNGDGIRLVQSTGVKITNNRINHGMKNARSKNACGIVLDKSKATVVGNTVLKSLKYGIFANNKSKMTCKRNTVKKYKKYGIVSGPKSVVKAKKKKYKNKVSGKKKKAYHSTGGKIK